MKDQEIELDTAILAWEKGFPKKLGKITQSLLQRWLREKHNIHITINCKRTDLSLDGFWYVVKSLSSKMFNTYEQALEEGLYKALKLIKN